MIQSAETTLDGTTLVVRIPMRFQRRRGRKRIVAPDGSELVPATKPQPDDTLVKGAGAGVALAEPTERCSRNTSTTASAAPRVPTNWWTGWRRTTRSRFDVVMAWSVDRLGRSLQDLVAFLGEVHEEDVDHTWIGRARDNPTGRQVTDPRADLRWAR
jgi:hypothetical protein